MHLGCFLFLAIKNNAAINIGVEVFVWTYVFNSTGYLFRSRTAGLCGNCVLHFEELLNCFLKCLTILHSHQQCPRVLIFLYPHQRPSADFLIIPMLVGMKWYLTVVCTWRSLMTSRVEHFLMCLLVIWFVCFRFYVCKIILCLSWSDLFYLA